MRLSRIKLVSEMVRRDMTALRLAELSGISRATISGIRCGRTCSDDTAQKLAEALGMPLADLIEKGD